MGYRLIWDKRFNVGVDIIDRDHKKLFSILNKLFDINQREKKSPFACQEAIKYFRDHATKHFTDEEAYMASIHYPGLETHRRIHRDFRERTLPALEHELELTDYSETSIHHFLCVCAGWLIGHTLMEDRMIVSGESIKHWEKLLPEEEQAVMEHSISSLLHDMFQLDSQLISTCYAGEKFGDVICCRLLYTDRTKRKWEFFLLFEKQLIGSIIDIHADIKSDAMDTMLSNVAKYAAKQLVERVKQHFPPLAQCEMAGEQLLTYDQFQKRYNQQSPQFSLLFDTGRGYFAYCMTTFERLQGKDSASVVTINTIAASRDRLHCDNPAASADHLHSGNSAVFADYPHHSNPASADHPRRGNPAASADRTRRTNAGEKAAHPKKKILVVDDSDFIRKTMWELLGGDYEVQTADSGLSAIKSITLARPDLILLDYEMPVCSGSQMLEMLRAENDYTDIPVIFLTRRVDRESVKKAIALRPEGYLSKSLPPESVKREIDHFFARKYFVPPE